MARRYKTIPELRIENATIPVYILSKAKNNHGEYMTLPKQRINVAPQEDGTMYTTLLHEALHAIADMHGINLSERTIRSLEVGIVSLIVQNPKLIALIQRHHGK